MKLSGWGRYPQISAKVSAPRNLEALRKQVIKGNTIARGNGRAYGDCSVSVQNTIEMKHFDHMLAFDCTSGQLVAEAGVILADIIDTFLPRGWFPYVTPGTKYVTIGGLIAADVHGKNHHKEGSFSNYVEWVDVITSDGQIKRCSRTENTDLFAWTMGGMGLTGIILRAAFKLRPVSSAWIKQHILVATNIGHAIELFEQSQSSTYSVAWIDCFQKGNSMGRALIVLGEHAEASELPPQANKQPLLINRKRKLKIPFDFPSWALNPTSIRTFNALYYKKGKNKTKPYLVDWNNYFYPLDAVLGWNKIYGRRGFAQFQCVLPLKNSDEGLRKLPSAIESARCGSFLAVLKRFGKQDSKFSFPMEGYTLALDFPINQKTLSLMNHLDDITVQFEGRVYLAKDSRMSRDVFEKLESRAVEYIAFRRKQAAHNFFESEQSKRLGL